MMYLDNIVTCANELKFTNLPLFDITNNCWKFGQDLLNGCWDMGIGNIVICRPAGGLNFCFFRISAICVLTSSVIPVILITFHDKLDYVVSVHPYSGFRANVEISDNLKKEFYSETSQSEHPWLVNTPL